MSEKQVEWCSVSVVVDDSVDELIKMTPPNRDEKQQPEFRVTKATLGLVPQDFARYQPSLERMKAYWHEEKGREMRKARLVDRNGAAAA
ncbi:MAG: hypothetical protein QOD33_1243 [Pyrinomonadaceae bacterium]|jgi:hypothetical protein|nr:hypothetical protein [Pyrinomonadaceae bacterium]